MKVATQDFLKSGACHLIKDSPFCIFKKLLHLYMHIVIMAKNSTSLGSEVCGLLGDSVDGEGPERAGIT